MIILCNYENDKFTYPISAEEVLVTDYPLNEALNVLKGINAFSSRNSTLNTGSFAQLKTE